MTWLKWDDAGFDHPKMLQVGCEEKAIHWSALTWVAQQETDGLVPAYALPLIVSKADPRLMANIDGHVEKLVSVGLWDRDSAGNLAVHGWLDWNPSAADIAAIRDKRSSAGQRGAASRWNGKR